MPNSRKTEILRIVREILPEFIDNTQQEEKRPTPHGNYSLFANVTENALHALKEGRNDEARRNLLYLLTTFRWNLSHKQAQNAVNYVKLESHLPAH